MLKILTVFLFAYSCSPGEVEIYRWVEIFRRVKGGQRRTLTMFIPQEESLPASFDSKRRSHTAHLVPPPADNTRQLLRRTALRIRPFHAILQGLPMLLHDLPGPLM